MRVCFSGHRKVEGRYPPSLKWQWVFSTVVGLCQSLLRAMGSIEFISGGAVGFDTVAAQAVIYMKNHGYKDITLTMALPFPGYNKNWPHGSIAEMESICNHGADKVLFVSQQTAYHPGLLQIRNVWMKDNSDMAIILWDGSMRGGTFNFCTAHLADPRRIPHIWIKPAIMEVVWVVHDPNNAGKLLYFPFQ